MFTDLTKHLLRSAFVVLPALAMLTSCGPERMIGDYYVKNTPKGAILLVRPEFIYKNNQMAFDLSDQMSEAEKDSVSFYRSSYLQYVSDSVFLDQYMNNFIDHMLSAGFDVYAREYQDSFMKVDPPAFIVDVAQLQLEESRDSAGSESLYNSGTESSIYPTGLSLNTLRLNSWFEVSELNSGSSKTKKVFFASSIARSAVKSSLKIMPENGELGYQYTVDTLNMNDVYELARQSGGTYADYLVDYFMNEYIRVQMPNGMYPQRYMHYDPLLRRVRNSQGEGFQEIKPEK